MLIVADTTPIISLIKVGLLELLNSMYGEIILPEAVFNELVSNPFMTHEAETIMKRIHNGRNLALGSLKFRSMYVFRTLRTIY